MTHFRSLALTLALMPTTALADLAVHSYASQVRDVDSVNSHWFETDAGTVLIDAQRLLPEAERALRHLRATTEQPVTAIIVSHAHTDHYGGLPVWLEAFPEAEVITDATTLASIRSDARGFIEMRNQRHGDRFATQDALTEAVADATVVSDGEVRQIGGTTLRFDIFGPSEAESTLTVTIEEADLAFIGDLVNVGAPAVPFEDVEAWLDQLDTLTTRYDVDDRLHIGHGPSPVDLDEVAAQRVFLTALRDRVAGALDGDDVLTPEEMDGIVFAMEADWPFLEGVAGNTRQEVLAFAAKRVALQLGGTVSEAS